MTNKQPKTRTVFVFKLGIISTLALLMIMFALLIATPIIPLMTYILPKNIVENLFKDVFQEITLAENIVDLQEPITFDKTLPVLGTDTGICFEFKTSIEKNKPEIISQTRLIEARRGKKIADIIAKNPSSPPYTLENVILIENSAGNAIICQKLGRRYSVPPTQITSITITPLYITSPSRIFWVTAKDILDDRVDYIP